MADPPPRSDTISNEAYPYLASLNPAQLKAVTADPNVPLQILAGPGSGKTRVLTSRVAYLVQHHRFRPNEIVAVTFTNKAANEMKKRLQQLLGAKEADTLILGTFHATCARYLRRYGGLIDLPNNFSISDADDCKKIISRLLKEKSDILDAAGIKIKDSGALSDISKAKARGESPESMAIRAAREPSTSTSTLPVIAEVYSSPYPPTARSDNQLYADYEATLREANSLDFDDLLVFGLRLFRTAPQVLETCRHILVDEFQDTNTTQYELMKCFAEVYGGVSVVGDPDQSIYGWRAAEVENLNKMTEDFPGVQAIYLEENYRSTGSILAAAHSIVSQDRERIQKSLYTSHPKSSPVCLKTFSTPVIEASFIATEIKRLVAYTGNVLNYGDFAILLRYNALSRVIEAALQKDQIPNRIVGGHKFFERMEIKDLLAYLQLADNPGFSPAFIRVVNVPRRAIGDKSVADLLSAAKAQKISPMELCERITDGDKLPAGIKPAMKKNLASFVGTVRKVRRAAERGMPVVDLLSLIIEKTGYEEYLRSSQQDFDSRWENVQELMSYSVVVAEQQQSAVEPETNDFAPASSAAVEAMVLKEDEKLVPPLHPLFRRTSSESTAALDQERPKMAKKRKRSQTRDLDDGRVELLDSDEDGAAPPLPLQSNGNPSEIQPGTIASMTPLSYFLQTSMLSTDTDADKDQADTPKVTITTVHAAKGLEWPVVFVPAVESGTFPSSRCTEPHEVAEERRLLYVAMTRAQTFLTMSYCLFRMSGAEEKDRSLSEFVLASQRKDPSLFSAALPDVDETMRQNTAQMLGRPPPDETQMKDVIMKHVRAAPPLSTWDAPERQDMNFNRFARREVTKAARAAEYWASEIDEYDLPDPKSGSGHRAKREPWKWSMDSHFKTARELASPEKKPPPKILKPTMVDVKPVPFAFGKPDDRPSEQGIGAFTNASSSSLAFMKTLGLPGPGSAGSGTSSPIASPNLNAGSNSFAFGSARSLPTTNGRSPLLPSAPLGGSTNGKSALVGGFQSNAAGGLAAMKSLGLPSSSVAAEGSVGGEGAKPKLAQGTKRLGMGRPQPWGAKKAKER